MHLWEIQKLKKYLNSFEKQDLTSPDAFGQLFEKTYIHIYRYLFGLTGGPQEDVEDLVAESFSRAWLARNSFQGNFDDALRWMLSIAKHQMIDSYRKEKSAVEFELNEDNNLTDQETAPETQALLNEKHQILWELLQALPEEPKEMIVLRYLLDFSIGEIAKYLGKNNTAVSMAIHRALKQIQQNWPIKDSQLFTRSEPND
jgi:RNA polymerase sigma-70 factor (ECF subfamily)